jgi:hypothetical protein
MYSPDMAKPYICYCYSSGYTPKAMVSETNACETINGVEYGVFGGPTTQYDSEYLWKVEAAQTAQTTQVPL